MIRSREELHSLIRVFEASAQTHIHCAKQAHTGFQRTFHERGASEALLKADRYRRERQNLQNSG
jgi:hypothetical protein